MKNLFQLMDEVLKMNDLLLSRLFSLKGEDFKTYFPIVMKNIEKNNSMLTSLLTELK